MTPDDLDRLEKLAASNESWNPGVEYELAAAASELCAEVRKAHNEVEIKDRIIVAARMDWTELRDALRALVDEASGLAPVLKEHNMRPAEKLSRFEAVLDAARKVLERARSLAKS